VVKHCLTLLLAMVCVLPAAAQNWNVDLIGSHYGPWSTAQRILPVGDYAFAGLGDGAVSVLDVRIPSVPLEVARWEPLRVSAIIAMEPHGNYLYVSYVDLGLYILDLSNPLRPETAAHLTPPGPVWEMTIAGDLMYLVCNGFFQVHDLADPLHPQLLGSFWSSSSYGEVEVSGNYAYLSNSGLQVLDVSDPAQIAEVSFLDLPGATQDLELAGGYAYIVSNSYGLYTIRITDLAHPVVTNHFDPPTNGYYSHLEASSPALYLHTFQDGIFVLDITQPATPILLSHYSLSAFVRDMTLAGTLLFTAKDYFGVQILDAANPQSLQQVCTYNPDWSILDVVQEGAYAYLAAGAQGLQILNVADPADIHLTGYLHGIGGLNHILKAGDYVYMHGYEGPLQIINVSDPAQPALAGSYPLGGAIHVIEGNLGYAGCGDSVRILDLSSPANPVEIGALALWDAEVVSMDLEQQYLYVILCVGADRIWWYDSLAVIDVSNPAAPVPVGGSSDLDPQDCRIVAHHEFVYVAGGWEPKIRIFDVSNPANPVRVGNFDFTGTVSSLRVIEGFMFIGCSDDGFKVASLNNPIAPVITGYTSSSDWICGMAVNGTLAYVADAGVFAIYDCAEAMAGGVTITLTPVNPPLLIPASGGSFDFEVALSNATLQTQSFQVWTMQRLPSGSSSGPLLGPVNLSLPAGGSLTRTRTQTVPWTAAPGEYLYIGYTGSYPTKWDSSYFSFTKLTNGDGPRVEGWACTGEPFPGETQSDFILHPSSFILSVSPNPFNPQTVARYEIRDASHVTLRVYDTAGREVATLADGWREAGVHEVTFDGSALPSGIYFARLKAGTFTTVQKLALVK